MFGTEQAFLFTIPKAKKNASTRSDFELFKGLDHFKDRAGPAGIIVRSIVNGSVRTEAVRATPVPDVIVVGADHDDLIFQTRIRAR